MAPGHRKNRICVIRHLDQHGPVQEGHSHGQVLAVPGTGWMRYEPQQIRALRRREGRVLRKDQATNLGEGAQDASPAVQATTRNLLVFLCVLCVLCVLCGQKHLEPAVHMVLQGKGISHKEHKEHKGKTKVRNSAVKSN
jgi:hypothetical protein